MPNVKDNDDSLTSNEEGTPDVDISGVTPSDEETSTVQDIDFSNDDGAGYDYSALIYDFLVTQQSDGPTVTVVEQKGLKMAVKHEITSGDMLVTLALTVVAVLLLLRMVYKR